MYGYPTGWDDDLDTGLGYRKMELGFAKKLVSGEEGWVTPTDVLCGAVDNLYTYDILLDDLTSWSPPARLPAVIIVNDSITGQTSTSTGGTRFFEGAIPMFFNIIGIAVVSVVFLMALYTALQLLQTSRARGGQCVANAHRAADEKQGYDLGMNDAARAAA